MSTYRAMAYSIQTAIKQNFDDQSVAINLIVYWINLIAKRARYDKIRKSNSDAYLVYFPSVKVITDKKTERKFSVLPSTIADLDYDYGIKAISYSAEDILKCDPEVLTATFSRTQAGKANSLYGNPFRKPSTANPFFYRTQHIVNGKKEYVIFYLGLECLDIDRVDMYLYSDESEDFVCDLDKDIDISPEMEKIVYYEVLNLVKYGYVFPSDKTNDGTDSNATDRTQRQFASQRVMPVYSDSESNQGQEQQYVQ